jgi:hypothetical protein
MQIALGRILGRRRGARSHAPAGPERGRAETRPLSYFFLALTLAFAGIFTSPACTTGDTPEVFSPDSAAQRIERGFARDPGSGTSLGHSVPLEGEIIKLPACVAEAGAGEACTK